MRTCPSQVLGGRYLHEILGRMATKAGRSNMFLEPRISIYARSPSEWTELAEWFAAVKPQHRHVLYAIQFPRVYHVWRKAKKVRIRTDHSAGISPDVTALGLQLICLARGRRPPLRTSTQVALDCQWLRGRQRWLPLVATDCPALDLSRQVATFADILHNFFGPLFEATMQPRKHASLAALLSQVSCIDTVDNEAIEDEFDFTALPSPSKYTYEANPPYSYYTYYFWHNLRGLNRLREARGLNTFELRPHAGEAGPVHHLSSTFLFAHGISHGINLERQPVLQYLYYLADIPISVSPISNSCLFLPYAANPFPTFFKRGLCVTLTTDDPLQFHMSDQPQLEEYTTAKHAWNLSMTDLSEIARNSVLISSVGAIEAFEQSPSHTDRAAMLMRSPVGVSCACLAAQASPELREELIGGPDPCDRCNVPKRRFDFRHDERLRNAQLVGLPPPVYPVAGLERHNGSRVSHAALTDTMEERAWRSKEEITRSERDQRKGSNPRGDGPSTGKGIRQGGGGRHGFFKSAACALM